jgi:hypothetical protein
MLQGTRSMRNKLANLVPGPFRLTEKGQSTPIATGHHVRARLSGAYDPNGVALGGDTHFRELRVAAPLGVHMDGLHEEGSGSAPNAAIPAARLLHYIRRGESHRSTCCHPDLHAGAQGNPRGGYC